MTQMIYLPMTNWLSDTNTQPTQTMKHNIKSVLEHGVIVDGKHAIGSYVKTYWGNLKVTKHIIK